MSGVSASIEIDAPAEAVWKVAMDPERLHEWVTIHRELEDHDTTHMTQLVCVRGLNFRVRWELEESHPPSYARWRGRGPARTHAETVYRLAATPDGRTRFDYHSDFRAPLGPLGAIAGRALVGGLPQREATATLRRLKALVERPARVRA